MRYIRTKDKIYDGALFLREYTGWYFNEKSRLYAFTESEIIKQLDTIDELCDEFVITNWKEKEKPILCKYLKDKNALYYIDETGFNALYIPDLLKSNCIIYGAIWTNKGIIYAAKMKCILPNGEVDWMLL